MLGLLKSGKLRLRHTIDQGDLIKLLGEWYEKLDLITRKFFSTETAQSGKSYRALDTIDGGPMEFEWNIFPGFTTLQLCGKINDLLSDLGQTPETFTGRILFMSMFNDISCGTKDNEEECLANVRLVSLYARRSGKGQWSFIGPASEKKWYSMKEDSPQGIWDHIADEMLLEFADSGCAIFRATTSLSRGKLKSKGHGKLSIHFSTTQETIETIFRIIVSANQLQKDYGRSWSSQVWKSGYEEHDRSGKPEQNSCDSLERVDPHRGEHLLGRTAHSARNEETIHERTGKPDSEDAQGKAHFEKFIVGSETTEFCQ